VEVIQGDICQPDDVAMAMADMDMVIHLAAHTGVVDSTLDPPSPICVSMWPEP
jgi:nucleoside-diphosphate-sugar epimerase